MAANEYYSGKLPQYPATYQQPQPQPQPQLQGFPEYISSSEIPPYYTAPTPPVRYTPGVEIQSHQFSHYLQQPVSPVSPPLHPQGGYLQAHQTSSIASPSRDHSYSPPPSPLPPGLDDGSQDRGLGSALIGGVAGSILAHKMGGGTLGTIAGAVGGALLPSHDHGKKKKKSRRHSHHRRSSGSGSYESGSGGSGSSGRGMNKKRYALGYSTGGGSIFRLSSGHKRGHHHHHGSESD